MKKSVLFLLLVFTCVCFISISCGKKNPNNEINARVMIKTFVERRLKNPADADFGYCPIEKTESGSYRMKCYVDATNSFGGKIRSNFTCEVKHAYGETWNLVELTFE